MAVPLTFLTWESRTPTGGNTYNRELVAALRARGVDVQVLRVPGRWPEPELADLDRLATALRGRRAVLADGIVACAAPAVVADAVAAGAAVTVLVHMPLGAEVGIPPGEAARRQAAEDQALASASAVVAASHAAARALAARGHTAAVAAPGVRPSPVAPGSLLRGGTAGLLLLGALSPTKDQLTAVQALAKVRDLPWTASFTGPGGGAYRDAVRDAAFAAGLSRRVELPGPLEGDALEERWQRTDLLLLASRWETYGMVVTEALARGIPALVSAGTGAVEALRAGGAGGGPVTDDGDEPAAIAHLPGAAVPPGDPDAWAAALRDWLTDADLRHQWRSAARAARDRLPTWESTADVVLTALRGV